MGGPTVTRPGPLLLQGGAEMQPGCRDMDLAFLELAPPGELVVVLGAASPGADHDRSSARALRYHEALGTGRVVTVAPHPEDNVAGCEEAVRRAAVVVLPGGSPSRLRRGMSLDGGRLGRALVERHRTGTAVSGSSAGAMVLCARTALPDAGGGPGGGLAVQDGLGLVPGLALVHDSGRGTGGWRDPVDPDGPRWALPEQTGVLLHEGGVRTVGAGGVRLLRGDRSLPVPRDAQPLDGVLAA